MDKMIRTIRLFFLIAILADTTFAAAPRDLFSSFNSILAAPPHGGADNIDLHLRIFPGGTSIPEIGENANQVQATPQIIAGAPFYVVVLVVDDQNCRVNADGHFKLSWSNDNYVNPSNPPAPYNPIQGGLHRSFRINNGLSIIPNIRYDECGMIQITGTAKIHAHGPPGNINLSGESSPFVVRPFQFLIQTDLPRLSDNDDDNESEGHRGHQNRNRRGRGNNDDDDDDDDDDEQDEGDQSGGFLNFTAGTPFSLSIIAVNVNGQITTNYPYDDLINLNQKFVSIGFEVVVPEDADGGELQNSQNETLNQFPASLFQYGECILNEISYTDVGIIDIFVEDVNYMGMQISGVLEGIGRFVPHHFSVTVDQPARIQGEEASYTYSGQLFSATVTITAKNGKMPPGTTVNYQGELAQVENPRLSIALPPHQSMLGSLEVPSVSAPIFEDGVATLSVEPLLFQYSSIQNPETMSVRYIFHRRGEQESFTDSDPVEFRSGRMRIHDRLGMAGDFLKLFVDVEYYQNDSWTLNQDEEVLSVSPDDFTVDELTGEGNVSIEGTAQEFFGGMIRGGYDPLRIECANIVGPLRFRIALNENTELYFLEEIPGHWYIIPALSTGRHAGYLLREHILYEKEI